MGDCGFRYPKLGEPSGFTSDTLTQTISQCFPTESKVLQPMVSSQWLETRHKSSRSYTQHCTHSHSVVISNSTVHTQGKQMSFPDSPELAGAR
uniref:Uncharacterized protein n=1 Tax=Anguilla anguilla TaxID=7936 RepID=A0A0E9WS49_ANGAN